MATMDSRRIESLVDAMSKTRFNPYMKEGDPVSVNMVWFVAHTTVRGGVERRHLGGTQFRTVPLSRNSAHSPPCSGSRQTSPFNIGHSWRWSSSFLVDT